MRTSSLLLAGLLLASAAAPVGAAPLGVQGSLAIQIGTLDPIAVLGSGVATASPGSHLGALSLPASLFSAAGIEVTVTDPAVQPIAGVRATVANQAASFAAGPNGFGGPMPLGGVAKVCLFVACSTGPPANVSVPLSVIGGGGSVSVGMLVSVTVRGSGWTTQTAAVATGFGTLTARGFAHGPASQTSSTANPGGVVRLVTPILISTDIAASAVVPAFGFLTLQFVPEPGTLLLLGSGIVGLLTFGRTRRG